MKKVSVIIPTYNRANYLQLTLDSVLNQSYRNIEIIIIDDGSPNDETEVLCGRYNNVQYYRINNSGGPAKPRNEGLKKCTGDYIAFLDDDDIWFSNKIEEQVKILEQSKSFGLVHSYCNVIDENGNPINQMVGKPGNIEVKHGDVKMRMIGNWTLMMPTPLVRRSVVAQVGYFNETIPAALEDVEFWTRCSFYTKFYYLDKALASYRQHSDNISTSNKNYVDLPLFLERILKNQLLEKRISKTEYKKLLLNVCFSQAKNVKQFPLKTFFNLFRLNPFWIVNFRVIKVIVKRLVT